MKRSSTEIDFCSECNGKYFKRFKTNHLKSLYHKKNAKGSILDNSTYLFANSSAFKKRILSYRILPTDTNKINFIDFLSEIEGKIRNLIKTNLEKLIACKVNIELYGEFVKEGATDIFEKSTKLFNTKNKIITKDNDNSIERAIKSFFKSILCQSSEFSERNSGYGLESILFLDLNINKYSPLKGSGFIPTPPSIANKRAIINFKKFDDKCFAYAVNAGLCLSAKKIRNNRNCLFTYPPFENFLNFDGIKFPVSLKDIEKFEKLNKISVNVYGLIDANEIIGPYHLTKKRRKRLHVNLLLLEKGNCFHYCLISNMSRLVRLQISANKNSIYFCDGCLVYFFFQKNTKTSSCIEKM